MNLTKTVSKDELRPALNCAVLLNGYFYATDAHVAVKIKAADVFTVETDNKVFDLDNLKVIARAKDIIFKDEHFLASGRKYGYAGTIDPKTRKMTMSEFSCTAYADDLTYPDIDAVIDLQSSVDLPEIGLNPTLLANLSKAFANNPLGHVKLEFAGKMKAVRVYAAGNTDIEQYGIIMPVEILTGKGKEEQQ